MNAHEINRDSFESDLFNELVDTVNKTIIDDLFTNVFTASDLKATSHMYYMYFILYLGCFASFLGQSWPNA